MNILTMFDEITYKEMTYYITFSVGLILFLTGIIVYFVKRFKDKKTLSFGESVIYEFLALYTLLIPGEIFVGEIEIPTVKQWIEGMCIALINLINSYSINAYERTNIAGHPDFSFFYGMLRFGVNILLIVFICGFIAKVLDGPYQRIRIATLEKKKKTHLFIFSECNEKTLLIAKSIVKKDEKYCLVFSCDASKLKENQKETIRSLGGMYIKDSISDITKKYGKLMQQVDIILFGEEEMNNIVALDNVCRNVGKVNELKIKILVELVETPWDMYDDITKKYDIKNPDFIVNFIRIDETFVYNNLLNHSIFENAIAGEKDKAINVLMVGEMNGRNIEMFKALLHLGQMPGYFLNITVIDRGNGRRKLKHLMPDVGDDGNGYGDAIYHIDYVENIDYESDVFESTILEKASKFTFGFVNTGDDILNIRLALLIQSMASRNKRTESDYFLQVILHNTMLCEKWNMNLCEGITVAGCMDDVYNYEFLTNSRLERGAEKIHLARHSSTPWNAYLNNEYNRHSVLARALSFKYKITLLGDNYRLAGNPTEYKWSTKEELEAKLKEMSPEEKNWKIYEHMRWNMYTRTLGYRADSEHQLTKEAAEYANLEYDIRDYKLRVDRCTDPEEKKHMQKSLDDIRERQKKLNSYIKKVRTISKIHPDLIMFKELPLAEQIKDNLEISEDVVEALRNM